MKKYLSATFALLLYVTGISAQAAIGNPTPDVSAMLDVSSTDKGLLIPRVSLTGTGDNTTVATTQISLLVYNTATAGSGGTSVAPGYYYWNGIAWEALTGSDSISASTWALNGNEGINPVVNFIGTTDSKPLLFKVKNGLAGKIYSEDHNTSWGYLALLDNTGKFNTAIGEETLGLNASGSSNTAKGYAALYNNTIGNSNTANGTSALYKNTTGNFNTANGDSALYYNTTGSDNTASGRKALSSNATGYANTANGWYALHVNDGGNSNTATGYNSLFISSSDSNTANGADALANNLIGSDNTANGSKALYSNNSGNYNTAIGSAALYSNDRGDFNTSNGYQSLFNNNLTIARGNTAGGFQALLTNVAGGYNSAFGTNALHLNSYGYNNTAMGVNALAISNSSNNTVIGFNALGFNTTGANNTAVGSSSLFQNATGSNNTAVGNSAGVASSNLTNATAIGAGAIADASNKVRIGNAAVTVIEGQVLPTTPSDVRFKFNIREDVHGLDFIMRLRPVSYQFDTKKLEEQMSGKPVNSNDATEASYVEANSMRHTGFIAQEVEKAATETGYHFTGINKPASDRGHYSLSYTSFIMPLVKAVQEQQGQLDKLAKGNEALNETSLSRDIELKKLKETTIKMQAAFVANQDLVAQQLKDLQAAIKKAKEQPSALK